MNATLRRIAVSGSAAVALLGGAAAGTVATADIASAAEMQTVIDRATGAPVKLPDGRPLRVPGLDTAGYRATDEQRTTVVSLASVKTDSNPGVGTGLTPDGGSGAAIQNPYSQTPVNVTPQQIQTQAGGGAVIGVGIVSILVLAILVWVKVKHSGLKAIDATLGILFGIALSGTVIGTMGSQLTNSLVGSMGTMLGGLG